MTSEAVAIEVLLFIATMPPFVVLVAAGAIAGALGGLIGLFLRKKFGVGKAWSSIPVFILMVISFNLSEYLIRKVDPLRATVSGLKQSRLFGVILKYHPEAEREYLVRFEKILAGPQSQLRDSTLALAAEMANRYVNSQMLTASDAAIHHLLQTEAGIIESLKNSPADCVAQYLGTPSASRLKAIPQSMVEASLDAKAEIVESSVVAPSPPPKTANIKDISGVITNAYRAKGYDTAEIAKIGNVQSLPPSEGCEVSYRFVSVLASMNEKQGSFAYKGLISAAK